MDHIFFWWVIVLITGLVTYPLAFVLFKHFPDKGYIFSKVLSLLLLGYFSWVLGYVSFGPGTIFFSFLLVILLSAAILWTWVGTAFFDYLKREMGFLLVLECLFLVSFLVAGAYKMRTHDIVGTEKPMELTFINGILSSSTMPPNDPWLSGGSISYYYFGYLITAILSRVTGVTAGEGFNLILALTWALAFMGAFSLAYALTKRYRYSMLSAASLTLFGNLDYWHRAIQVFNIGDLRVPYYHQVADPNAAKGLSGALDFLMSPLQHSWDYFQASRIIPVSTADKMITEFPSFSFFLSDIHPHVLAIPFVLLAIALAYNFMKSSPGGFRIFGGSGAWEWGQLVLSAMVLGSLAFLNIADFPTYLGLAGLCLALQQGWAYSDSFKNWLFAMIKIGAPLVMVAFLLYIPFYTKYQSQVQGLGIGHDRTDLYYLFVMFGFFFAIFIPTIRDRALNAKRERPAVPGKKKQQAAQLRQGSEGQDVEKCVICGKENPKRNFCGFCGGEVVSAATSDVRAIPDEEIRSMFAQTGSSLLKVVNSSYGWILTLVVIAVLFGLNMPSVQLGTLWFTVAGAAFCVMGLSTKTESREMVFTSLLVLIGLLLIAGCELIYVKDLFSGDLYRMNTVFKYYYQVWILFSLASGPMLKWLFENQWPRWASWQKGLWSALAVFVFVGAGLYPVLAFSARVNGTSVELATLDGAVYYERAFPADYQVAQFIKANVKPVNGKVPVILEAWGGSYAVSTDKAGGRVATLTGYPTVLGWDFHEVQWRGTWDKAVIRGQNEDDTVMHRREDIDQIYTSPDVEKTRGLLKKYGVDYLYVGETERQKYAANIASFGKFDQLGVVAWHSGNSVLYKLNP